jgi:integrase
MACTILPPPVDDLDLEKLDGDLDPEKLDDEIRKTRARLAELEAAARELRRKATGEKPEPRRMRFTKTAIAALKPPSSGILIVWDTVISGLGCRIMSSGTKSYFLQRRTKKGEGVKLTVGRCDRITSEMAREKARELISRLELGERPDVELRAARRSREVQAEAPTVTELWQRWLADHAQQHKAMGSLAADASLWRNHIEPRLGRLKVAEVEREHVARLHAEVTRRSGPVAANRTLALLSTLFGYGELHLKLRVGSPTKGVKRNREHKRERYLKPHEIRRLLAVLDGHDDLANAALRLLLLTGARKGELLSMRWSDIDLSSSTWTKPASITKQQEPHHLALSTTATALLAALPAPSDPAARVFRRLSEAKLRRAWEKARDAARLDGVRLHDLRHAHASLAISAGIPLAVVGGLLGHSNHATTSRYAHLHDDPQRAAAERVGELLEALRGGAEAEVVPLTPRSGGGR